MNQKENFEEKKMTESMADLPLADEQAEETKAGTHRGGANFVFIDGSVR